MNKKYPYIYILITTFFFSSMEVAIKSTNNAFNPIQLNFLRFLIAGFILFPLAKKKLLKSNYKLTKKDYKSFIFLGFCQVVIAMSFFTLSIVYIKAHLTAIILSCNSFFSIIFAYFLLKEKINKETLIALIICFIGILIIANPVNFQGEFIGIVYALLSSILFGLYSVLTKYFTKGKPTSGVIVTCYGFIFGSLELLILILITKIPEVSNFFQNANLQVFSSIPIFQGISKETIFKLLYICIGVTGIGFTSYFLAIEKLPISTVSLVFLLKPIFAPIIDYLVLGDLISKQNTFGLVFILIGSIIVFIYSLKNDNETLKTKKQS